MHWQKTLLLPIAAVIALGVASGAASSAPGRYSHQQRYSHHHARHVAKKVVKARIHKGTLTITGSNRDDDLVLALDAGNPSALDLMVDGTAVASFDRSRFNALVVDAGRGNDEIRIDESNGAFTDSVRTTLDGGPGDDRIAGGSGAETLVGGYGDDTVDGNRGNDSAFLGAGDDTFIWDPGDGSDTVEGEDGTDTMRFNGANIAEKFDLSANGRRLRFFRDIGNITMDTAGGEIVDVNDLGGAVTVTVNDLTGTDVTNVHVDNGGADGQPDQTTVNGTAAADHVAVDGGFVNGLAARVQVEGFEPTDQLAVSGLAGDDALFAPAAQPLAGRLDGGDGT